MTKLPPGLPDFAAITPETIEATTANALAEATRSLDDAIAASGSDLLDRVSDAARQVWTAYGQGAFLFIVHPDAAIRDAAGAASESIEAWRARVFQRPDLLQALDRLDGAALDGQQAAVRDRWIRRSRAAGAHLDGPTRERLAVLGSRVAELAGTFMANQNLDRPSIQVARSRLAGLPADVLEGLPTGDADGTARLSVDHRPLVLEHVRDRGIREAIQRAWLEQAPANAQVLTEMVEIHRSMAALLGVGSWAELRASVGMAGSLAAVERFLDDLEPRFLEALDRQLEAARQLVARDAGEPVDGFVLQDWDTARGLALLREAAGVDAAELRAHLPLSGVINALGRVVERAFGVRVIQREGDFGWHPDVRRLDLVDLRTGEELGSILLDPFAREGKMPGPAGVCDIIALGLDGQDGSRPRTHVGLVTYFPPVAAGGAAYITPSDVLALFHELGHSLDYILGSDRFAPIDTADWIPDWSEAPSQSIGYWALLPDVLLELSSPDASGAPLSAETARAFAAASRAGAAIENARFLWLARLDLALHGPELVDVDAAWRAAWPLRRTPPVIDHLATTPIFFFALGYDAVAYGFLWSQVYLDEILGRFEAEGGLSAAVGRSYREELLEPGWAPDPLERMRRFLGRQPTIDRFLARLSGDVEERV